MAVYKDNIKTKDGRQWYFKVYKKDFNGNNKAFKSKRYETKKEAQEAERLFLLKRDNPVHKKFKIIALDYFEYSTLTKKESTLQTYKEVYYKHISPYFDDYNLDSINIPILNKFREIKQNKGYSVRYLNKINNVLNKILDYAVINYGLPSNLNKVIGAYQEKKDKVISNEEKIRYITYEEFKKFISVIDDLTWKTFFTLLYFTGMRKGEVLALTFKDIKNDTIIINKTLYTKVKGKITITSTKNNLNRIVKMNKSLYDIMQQYITYMKSFSDYRDDWFLFGGYNNLAPTTIDRYKKYYFELSNVHEITIHEFRHSAVSLLANEVIKKSNGKIDTANFFLQMSKRFGHSPEVMQRTYMHLFEDNQDDIVDILDNL